MQLLRVVRGTFAPAALLLAAGCASDLVGPTRVTGSTTELAPASAAALVGTVVVRPSSMNGWYFWNDRDDTFSGSPGELVAGPAAPPAGSGSVRLGPLTDNGATGAGHSVIATNAYLGTPLAELTGLSYSTYQVGPTLAIALQFDVQYRTTDVAYGGRLVFEPYQTVGTVGAGWQTWSPLAGKWWASKTTAAGSNGLCPQATPCTWAQVATAFPDAVIAGRFLLKAGSSWSGFDGNADNLVVTVGSTSATYDFEPETQCTATCYVDAVAGNDAFGGDAQTSAKKTIQAAINQVSAGGVVRVLPGTYNEFAPNSAPTSLGGIYQFGLFFGSAKPGVTLMGVTAADVAITDAAATLATITTNATNNFGTSGIFVEADNTTIQGVTVGPNIPGDNKTIEIVADGFTLQYSATAVPGGGAIYFGEFDPPAGSVASYHILNNRFTDATQIALSSGAGQTGAVGSREIKDNTFDLGGESWPAISFNGSGGVPWFTKTVGGAVISGNTFSGGAPQYIRARGTYIEAQFDWQAWWNGNAYDKAAVALVSESPFAVRSFSYVSGSYTLTNVRRIGSTIQGEVDNAAAGDMVLVKDGTYPESPRIGRSLTLKSQSGQAVTTIALQSGPTSWGSVQLEGAGSNITIDGFTIMGHDAVGPASASTNVYLTAGLGTVTVKNNRFEVGDGTSTADGDDGIGLLTQYSLASVTPSLVVENNTFAPRGAAAVRAFYVNPGVAVYAFGNNTITGRFDATAITQAKSSMIENNTLTGVGGAGSRSGGFGTWGYPDRNTWGHATFRGNAISGTRGIRLYESSSVTIEKNVFSNNQVAVGIDGDSDPLTIQTHRNSITGSDDAGVINSALAATSATCNWWGSDTGPGPVGAGSGDKVSSLVTYNQWLLSSDLNGNCGDNVGPITTLAAPAPAPVTFSVYVNGSVSDLTTGNAPLLSYTWTRDGLPGATVIVSPSVVTKSFTLAVPADASADVDEICVLGTDVFGNVGEKVCVLAVWYDPSAGFVTGGGWINSPAGAYALEPTLSGKANFGFVSKYQNGKTTPTGTTEFQFKAGNLNFSSTSYEWLVVSGARAQYRGAGTINGNGDYRFMLTAIDGQVAGGGGADKFRLRIWSDAGLVYDNQMSAPETADPTTVIGGGSIVIHR